MPANDAVGDCPTKIVIPIPGVKEKKYSRNLAKDIWLEIMDAIGDVLLSVAGYLY